jgi:7-cyano-7-deazaguanine synthase
LIVAIVSGGLDSISYLALWLSRGHNAYALTFNYGQSHSKEVEVAKRLVRELDKIAAGKKGDWGRIVDHKIVDLSFMKHLWKGVSLLEGAQSVPEQYDRNLVAPLRNVIMLSIASAYAYSLYKVLGEKPVVIYGSNMEDASIRDGDALYPDCTPECAQSLEAALRICHFRGDRSLEIWSPAREGLSKADLARIGYSLIGDLIYETWSCYRGGETHCGRCPACLTRKEAFRRAGIPDKTLYAFP